MDSWNITRSFYAKSKRITRHNNLTIITCLPQQDNSTAVHSNTIGQQTQKTHYFPSLMVANVMFLVFKIAEIHELLCRRDISLAFITEIWLKETVADSVVIIFLDST